MHRLSGSKFFDEMKDSTFTFLASTRVWFSPAASVPARIRMDLKKVRSFALSGGEKAAIELVFTGPISIYRGEPQLDAELGRRYIPMQVAAMEEYGYSRELDTTIRMTAKANSKNFGYTYQLSENLDTPAEARMLMTLEFTGVHGRLADVFNKTKPTVAKDIAAVIHAFPFTNGNTMFRHVGEQAEPITGNDGTVFGYLAYGTMVPVYQLGDVQPGLPKGLKKLRVPKLSRTEEDFLRGVISTNRAREA
jgi:hypothetical protein